MLAQLGRRPVGFLCLASQLGRYRLRLPPSLSAEYRVVFDIPKLGDSLSGTSTETHHEGSCPERMTRRVQGKSRSFSRSAPAARAIIGGGWGLPYCSRSFPVQWALPEALPAGTRSLRTTWPSCTVQATEYRATDRGQSLCFARPPMPDMR